MKTGSEYSHSH